MVTQETDSGIRSSTPIFTILAGAFCIICLFTPIILLTMPIMVTIACAVISIFRKEKPRWLAPFWIVASIFVMVGAGSSLNKSLGTTPENLSAAEVIDSSWSPDPSFGNNGTVKWRVRIANKTDRSIEHVKVDFSTFDSNNKLLTHTFSYVDAIPAMGYRDDESFADYYGTEATANFAITSVKFSE